MFTNPNFSHRSYMKPINLKKSNFWVGLIIFLVQSIAIYSFCNVLLDTIRITCYYEHEFYILNHTERYYFNLIFAYFGLITGFHSFLKWVAKPLKEFSINKAFLRRQPWRDQFYLSEILFFILFAFIFFYGRLNFVITGWFLDVSSTGYLWMFPFIVLVFYFLSIFIIFSKRRMRFRLLFIILSFITLSLFAVGLANLNMLDYKKWDHHFLEINPHLNCHFSIPESKVYDDEYYYRRGGLKPIYFYHNQKGSLEVIFDHSKIPFSHLGDSLQEYFRDSEEMIRKVPVYLDANLSFEEYQKFRKLLYDLKINWIQIIIQNPRNYDPFNNPREKVVQYRLSEYLFEPPMDKTTFKKEFSSFSNIIQVSLSDSNSYMINDVIISSDSLKNTLKTWIQKDKNYLIHYKFKKEISFGIYFKFIIKAKEALYEINNDQLIDLKNSELLLYSNDQKEIPFILFEDVY